MIGAPIYLLTKRSFLLLHRSINSPRGMKQDESLDSYVDRSFNSLFTCHDGVCARCTSMCHPGGVFEKR